ncbi:hypothetical protein WUBG_16852 [Wuchereria bancrofti]|uniref:Uncharacterized protein n=1 Tax=Wuchereria bancrofti TaxID=6293 RepID=J9EA42_WUCBA|nr:hypothetical protein WUBG_16852 [Wuchereria bancrofti]
MGLFGIWMSSSFGLRFAILIAAWANSIGATIRLISSFLPLQIRFPVGIFGQAVAACAVCFEEFSFLLIGVRSSRVTASSLKMSYDD